MSQGPAGKEAASSLLCWGCLEARQASMQGRERGCFSTDVGLPTALRGWPHLGKLENEELVAQLGRQPSAVTSLRAHLAHQSLSVQLAFMARSPWAAGNGSGSSSCSPAPPPPVAVRDVGFGLEPATDRQSASRSLPRHLSLLQPARAGLPHLVVQPHRMCGAGKKCVVSGCGRKL